jgi:hypothetical protein
MRKFTKIHRQRISEAKKGRPHTKKHSKNIARALKGKKFTDEHKKRISASLRGNCNAWRDRGCSDRIIFGLDEERRPK